MNIFYMFSNLSYTQFSLHTIVYTILFNVYHYIYISSMWTIREYKNLQGYQSFGMPKLASPYGSIYFQHNNDYLLYTGSCCWTITFCECCHMKSASSSIWSYSVWWAIRCKRSLWTSTMSQMVHQNCSPTCWTTCHVSNGLSLYINAYVSVCLFVWDSSCLRVWVCG